MRIEWYGKILHVITDNEEMMGRITHQEIDGELKPISQALYIELDEPHMPVFGVSNTHRIAIEPESDLLDGAIVDKTKAALVQKILDELALPLAKLTILVDSVGIDFYSLAVSCNVRGHHVVRTWTKEDQQIRDQLKGRPL